MSDAASVGEVTEAGGLTSDAIIPVTIGVLAAAFSATLVVILFVLCRRRFCGSARLQQIHCGSR